MSDLILRSKILAGPQSLPAQPAAYLYTGQKLETGWGYIFTTRDSMRTFKSNEDIYSFAIDIIALAKAQTDNKTVKLVQDAIDRGGLFPSERLGELLFAFEMPSRETKMEYIILLQDEIKAAIYAIDEAFKKANRMW